MLKSPALFGLQIKSRSMGAGFFVVSLIVCKYVIYKHAVTA